ncbi:hypothetical protein B5F86_01075 [Lachnoclostridium sp. An298]|nr:hypothetical protein B5F86_01075 [Lachnoclostridium sp. An298]
MQACLLTASDVSRHMAIAIQREEAAKQRNGAVVCGWRLAAMHRARRARKKGSRYYEQFNS